MSNPSKANRALRFITTLSGCICPISHQMTSEGYFRKTWVINKEVIQERFHRFIFRAHHGDIPEGHDVHHTCENRACCNPRHLETLPKQAHGKQHPPKALACKGEAQSYWTKTRCSGLHLRKIFSIGSNTAHVWIREWKGFE